MLYYSCTYKLMQYTNNLYSYGIYDLLTKVIVKQQQSERKRFAFTIKVFVLYRCFEDVPFCAVIK